jgi:NAD-dependent SIR2 family protein deacetylase
VAKRFDQAMAGAKRSHMQEGTKEWFVLEKHRRYESWGPPNWFKKVVQLDGNFFKSRCTSCRIAKVHGCKRRPMKNRPPATETLFQLCTYRKSIRIFHAIAAHMGLTIKQAVMFTAFLMDDEKTPTFLNYQEDIQCEKGKSKVWLTWLCTLYALMMPAKF